MSYKVQFLNDEQFEALPFREMHNKVGVADPSTQRAYVRKSGVQAMDVFNAMHELQHLEEQHKGETSNHFDPEYGVYYKGFGDVIRTIAPIALPFVLGPILGPIMKGIGGIAGNFGLGNIFGNVGAGAGGYAANAGRIGAGMGLGLGSGTAAGSAGASAAGLGGLASAGASKLGMLGPSGSASRAGAGQMIGGQAVHDTASGFGGGGLGSSLSGAAKQAGGAIAQNAAGSLFGGQSPLEGFKPPSLGSDSPNTIAPSGGNVIPGASGEGSQGGPGAAPGSIGGGTASKLRRYLDERDNPSGIGNAGLGVGGNF